MLELLFGNKGNFIISFAVISALILYAPLIVASLSALVTWFVTRGAVVKPFMLNWTPITLLAKRGFDSDYEFNSYDAMAALLALFGVPLSGLLGLILWHTPFWGYIAIGSVAGVLITARFAYSLYSKFNIHIEKLHTSSDAEEYKAKW